MPLTCDDDCITTLCGQYNIMRAMRTTRQPSHSWTQRGNRIPLYTRRCGATSPTKPQGSGDTCQLQHQRSIHGPVNSVQLPTRYRTCTEHSS